MSRIKLILSILLMLVLLLVGIILPAHYRSRKSPSEPEMPKETSEDSGTPEELTEMDFLSFEELSQFFSAAQTASLKKQFPVYLTGAGRTDITSAAFLPEETRYPDTTTVELHFLLSDERTLPVFYDTMTGVFSFGEEKKVIDGTIQTYEKPVDDTLPSISSSEVETRQEGGYADVTAPPQVSETKVPDPISAETDPARQADTPDSVTEEVQP